MDLFQIDGDPVEPTASEIVIEKDAIKIISPN